MSSMLWMVEYPSNLHAEILTPEAMAFRGGACWGWCECEGRALMVEIITEIPEMQLATLTVWRLGKEAQATHQGDEGPLHNRTMEAPWLSSLQNCDKHISVVHSLPDYGMFFPHTSETDRGNLLFTAGLQVSDTPSSPDLLHDPPAQKCQPHPSLCLSTFPRTQSCMCLFAELTSCV